MRLGLLSLVMLSAAACVVDRSITSNTEPTSVEVSPLMMSATAGASSFVILGKGENLSAATAASLRALGAEVTVLPEIGVAFASSADPDFAAKAGAIDGVQAVAADFEYQWVAPQPEAGSVEISEEDVVAGPSAVFGSGETFRNVQWAPDAIHAPDAWDAGVRGAGARVAILDGGIHSTHLDIRDRIDVARSRSFVANQAFNADVGTFWHGTHVAGIVAAPGQGAGTVGIAPDATIIGVKVLHNGSGSFAAVINGIVYAATPIAEGGAGAHIINMSLGALVQRGGSGIAHLAIAIERATKYADRRGVLVVASAGNDAVELNGGAFNVPSDVGQVLAISATGPMGWALGSTDVDRPASYTNFGTNTISVAGPGGDFVLPGNQVCSKPRIPTGTVAAPCWVMDMVMAPCRGTGTSIGTYCFAAGTSMAAPAVSGVAALVIGKFGPMAPQKLRHHLEQSADDLGKPGNDDFYGRGRINALRAVQ